MGIQYNGSSKVIKKIIDTLNAGGGGGGVTGVKGDAEANYRTGNVNITAANIGAQPTLTAGDNVDITNNVISVDLSGLLTMEF